MPWTVVWMPNALDNLAERWVAAEDKSLVTTAAEAIDNELRNDPENKGQDFYGDWMLEVPPLAAVYRLRPDDRIVEIHQIQRSGPPA
jgi:hypothetical protein